jgi:hypothetical protein
MIIKKTERELLKAIDFATASTFLSGLPINPERTERYKAMIRGGITAENFFKVMAEDREKILQRIQSEGRTTD